MGHDALATANRDMVVANGVQASVASGKGVTPMSKDNGKTAATALAPGFRFHPTDEELVTYYLKRKVLKKPVRFNAIGEVDIYRHEPWDLAVFSKLKTRDQEWYFFSALDKKYGNGARMNRATGKGYWKATGKDREVRRDTLVIGMKKTLVFHSGRAPDGTRTNWVMHEYRLVEAELERHATPQDAYVLCRVFHKNNIGPPSGNRYAPFIEEEWNEDAMVLIPGDIVGDDNIPAQDGMGSRNYGAMGSRNYGAMGSSNIEQETDSGNNMALININEVPKEVDAEPIGVVSNNFRRPREDVKAIQLGCKGGDFSNSFEHPKERPKEAVKAIQLGGDFSNNYERPKEAVKSIQLGGDFCNNYERPKERPREAVKPLQLGCKGERWENKAEDCTTPVCVLNKEAPLPMLQYKRRRHNDSNNSSRTTQDHCSSTTTAETASATTTAISALLEFALGEQVKHSPAPAPLPAPAPAPAPVSPIPPNCLKLIEDLQKEMHKMSVERESFKLEMMSAEAVINILQSRLDALRKENEDLKKTIVDDEA